MPDRPKAIMFDVDAASTLRLKEALPGWRFESMRGDMADTPARQWEPGAVDLFVLGSLGDGAAALKLCRTLASRAEFSGESRQERPLPTNVDGNCRRGVLRQDAPILFLVSSEQQSLGRSALECGAHSCLERPLRIKKVTHMLAHLYSGHEKAVRQMPRNSAAPFSNDRAL